MVSNSRVFDVAAALVLVACLAWGIWHYGQYAQLRVLFLYCAAVLLLFNSGVALKRRVDYLATLRPTLRSIKIKRQKVVAEVCGFASVFTLAVNLFGAYAAIDQHAFQRKYAFLETLENQFGDFLSSGRCGDVLVDQCNELKSGFMKVKGLVFDESNIQGFEKDVLALERHMRAVSENKAAEGGRDTLLRVADSLHDLVPINDDFAKIRSVVVYTISMVLALISIYTKIAIAIIDAYGNWPVDILAIKRLLARCDVFIGCSLELRKRSIRFRKDEKKRQSQPSAYRRYSMNAGVEIHRQIRVLPLVLMDTRPSTRRCGPLIIGIASVTSPAGRIRQLNIGSCRLRLIRGRHGRSSALNVGFRATRSS